MSGLADLPMAVSVESSSRAETVLQSSFYPRAGYSDYSKNGKLLAGSSNCPTAPLGVPRPVDDTATCPPATSDISAGLVGTADEAVGGEGKSHASPWFTGSLFSATAATLPTGHFLIEPYLYAVRGYGVFRSDGSLDRRGEATSDLRSLTLILYGVTNRLMVGFFPRFGRNSGASAQRHSRIEVGDSTARIQYRLSRFDRIRKRPMLSIAVDETVPTGRHDRLDVARRGGLGSGAWITTISTFAEYTIWPVSGHGLRARLNISYSLPASARIRDVSAYGTPDRFRGHAQLGEGQAIGLSLEYALTQNIALCSDLLFSRQATTKVAGIIDAAPYLDRFRRSVEFAVAPAAEYNWAPTMGVIAGVRFPISGKNTRATIYPVVAVNMIF